MQEVALFDTPFDVQAVMRTVGPAACARGLNYYENGAVRSLSVLAGTAEPVYVGTVQGNAPRPYSVTVRAGAAGARAATARAQGTCSCPVAANCKHVAAVMFAVGRGTIDDGFGSGDGFDSDAAFSEYDEYADRRSVDADVDADEDFGGPGEIRRWAAANGLDFSSSRGPSALIPGRGPSASGRAESPAPWEKALNLSALRQPQRRQAAAPQLALLIEPRTRGDGALSLSMRPVRMGERGRWIRTGISWRDLSYTYHGLPEHAATLLREILTLFAGTAASRYYAPDPTTIDLVTFSSARIWTVLGESADAGLPLVGSLLGSPVLVSPEVAVPTLDIRRGANGSTNWFLLPQVAVGGVPLEPGMTLLGDPAHGVAWLTPQQVGGTSEQAVHLARFAEPLATAPRRLLTNRAPVRIPHGDHVRFLREYLPALRAHLAVTSGDASVELPEPEPAVLVLVVSRDGERRVRLGWHWRYEWAGERNTIPLGSVAHPELRDPAGETALLATVLNLARELAPLATRGARGWELAPDAVLTPLQAIHLSREVLPGLAGLDRVVVEIADGALDFHEATGDPVISVSTGGSAAGSPVAGPEATDWLDLTITVTVDGETVFLRDLFRALAAGEEYVVLASGRYFLADHPDLKQLQTLIEESFALIDRDAQSVSVNRFNASLWAELDAMGVLDDQARAWSASVRELARITEIAVPPIPGGFNAVLRPYQQTGYTWLSFLTDHRLGGVLADDMGLGKTVQALAMITRARSENPGGAPFLVVAPTSVVSNWADEARRFAPGLAVVAITATESRRGAPLAELAAGVDLVVTSYALFRLEYEAYEAISWSALLLDEAQQIKNHLGKGYRCARSLPVPVKIVITGTPMENNLMELWAMFSIVAPGLLGDPLHFTEQFRHPIERSLDSERLATLRRRIRPLLLRRTKGEVVRDLPAKTEQVVELELPPKQRRAYQRFLQRERRKVLGLVGDLDRNRFQIFRSLTLLRQAAIDVSLVEPELADLPSAKLDAVAEIVEAAAAEGHRVLVFSQFTRFLARVKARLDVLGINYCYLDGRTRRRAAVLDEFRSGTAPAFLISLKAGGVGLNLTEADYCILADPWWNPATEQQAIDRTHRIGQTRPVMVYRLVARDTIEDKVLALSARKAKLTASVMADGGLGTAGLTAADIRALLE